LKLLQKEENRFFLFLQIYAGARPARPFFFYAA